MSSTEETPLLWRGGDSPRRSSLHDTLPYHQHSGQLTHKDVSGNNPHAQFCTLVGCPPSSNKLKDKFSASKKSLYGRTTAQLSSQRFAYAASASISNLLLLSQVILGAALTGLGASESSHVLITIFGALNTVIAGLVAYLKSRGQPMRARMYRDDLERVVDEIENSEVMWRGISEGIHGYDEIDTDEVTVRSEVARLTRLYERAVRLNGMNNPDMYMAGAGGSDGNSRAGMRPRGGAQVGPAPEPQDAALPAVTAAGAPQPSGENPGPAVPLEDNPEDAAPATKVDVHDDKKEDQKEESNSDGKKPSNEGTSDHPDTSPEASTSVPSTSQPTSTPSTQPPPAQAVAIPIDDPDASPATAARLKPKRTKSDKARDDHDSDHEHDHNHDRRSGKVAGDDEVH